MYVEAAGQYILPYEGPEGFNSNNTPASNVSDFSSQAVSRYLNFRKPQFMADLMKYKNTLSSNLRV